MIVILTVLLAVAA
jgi:hypothetical protein